MREHNGQKNRAKCAARKWASRQVPVCVRAVTLSRGRSRFFVLMQRHGRDGEPAASSHAGPPLCHRARASLRQFRNPLLQTQAYERTPVTGAHDAPAPRRWAPSPLNKGAT